MVLTGLRAKFARGFSHAWNTMYNMLDAISALLWRLLEVHIIKAVMFTVFIVALGEVTLLCQGQLSYIVTSVCHQIVVLVLHIMINIIYVYSLKVL